MWLLDLGPSLERAVLAPVVTRGSAATTGQAVGTTARTAERAVAMCAAMCAASEPTKPSSADPRVCCHGQAEEIQAGDRADAPQVNWRARGVDGAGDLDERVVGAVPGGPHDRRRGDRGAVGEDHRGGVGGGDPGMQSDPGPGQLPGAGPDDQLSTVPESPAQTGTAPVR